MKPTFKDFDPTKFKNELTKINWKNKLQIRKNNPHLSERLFLKTIEELLNRQCPIKKVSQKISYNQKPWIKAGLANSINKINNIYKQFCKSQDITKKIAFQTKFRFYRNPCVTVSGLYKERYFQIFF